MKKKILIIGSKGMAGHVIYMHLKSLGFYYITDISRNNTFFISTYTIFDITEFNLLSHVLETEKPDIIINCIGMLIQASTQQRDKAILVNSYLPHFLARKAKKLGFKLIHISTDCVFSGNTGNYSEKDQQDGIGPYAQSKALGEVDYDSHLTIRTSLIGPELKPNGVGLFHWYMQQAGIIDGYVNAIWTGVTTIELAKKMPLIIEGDWQGIIHLTNNQKISKYALLNTFQKYFNRKEITIRPNENYTVDKSLINTKTPNIVNEYNEMIIEMHQWILDNKQYYENYLK